jgi:hypothetical protein
MWQAKREISRECNDIIGSAKESQKVGKWKRADIYLEVRKRRGIYFLNETSACGVDPILACRLCLIHIIIS